ncbi:cobalt ECF transporter T component CbiQ [Geomonas sp. Red32]|uniref:cobalt ECF transporter T component CbiQ n=1 Tax=Geomonas sp. Red32 TaxID=2912856 RepID=UPI00202CF67E|nr:cobalt ECF transporter T component CbiQ [Geomonas sp. Red32]MCM0081088.1 cobalt ECF transporter T component CbiQ [Geomonas sp. Red32]
MHHFTPHNPSATHLLTRLDARVKLLCVLALLLMVISCHGMVFPLVVAFLCCLLCLRLGLPAKLLLLRFSEPLFIASGVLLLKLFFSGHLPLFTLDIFGLHLTGYRDGLLDGAAIASRIMGGVSLVALFGFATPFTEVMAALSWLKVPQALVDVSLFAWRYLFLLIEEAQVVYQAQRNRLGYAGYRRGLSSFGTLAGVLVIKAFDNSQNVTTAMVQRGYDGRMPMLSHQPFRGAEVALSILVVAAMGVLRMLVV